MSITVVAFHSSHGLLHSLAMPDSQWSYRVAFISISENFARKSVLEDISIEGHSSLGNHFRPLLGGKKIFLTTSLLIVGLTFKCGRNRNCNNCMGFRGKQETQFGLLQMLVSPSNLAAGLMIPCLITPTIKPHDTWQICTRQVLIIKILYLLNLKACCHSALV